jgi:hypothetical protein
MRSSRQMKLLGVGRFGTQRPGPHFQAPTKRIHSSSRLNSHLYSEAPTSTIIACKGSCRHLLCHCC